MSGFAWTKGFSGRGSSLAKIRQALGGAAHRDPPFPVQWHHNRETTALGSHGVCVWGMSEPPRARCTQKNLQECQRDMTTCPAQSRYAPVLYVFAKPDSPCASWCTQRAPEESLCTPLEYRQFLTGVSLYSVGMCKKHPN